MSIKHIKSIWWCSLLDKAKWIGTLRYLLKLPLLYVSPPPPMIHQLQNPTLFATYQKLLPVSSEWRGQQSVVLLGIISSIVLFKFGWQYTVVWRNLYNVLILSALSWIHILAWLKTLAKSAGHVRLMKPKLRSRVFSLRQPVALSIGP